MIDADTKSNADIIAEFFPEPKVLYQGAANKTSRLPTGWKSKTESQESFRKDAILERRRLIQNGTIPNHIVQLNYLTELTEERIMKVWEKQSRVLEGKGIIARAALEITKDEWKQRPVNRIHYHIVVKDHNRTHAELKELFVAVWQCAMLPSTFKVNVLPFDENKGGWKGFIDYFVKLRNDDDKSDKKKENYLLAKGLSLRRYYTIGKWWTYKDGTPRTLQSINKEIQFYAIKERLKMSEKYIAMKEQWRSDWQCRADQVKLQEVLEKESIETLYDWFSVLQGKPTLFDTKPPGWLRNTIPSQKRKCYDLLDAIYERLRSSDNTDILNALAIYHGYKIAPAG